MTEGLGFGKRRLIENIVKTNWLVDDPNKKNFNYNELLYVVQEMNDQEGKAYLEGGENYVRKGHNVFKLFVEYLLRRNLANYDSMLLLTALKGGGKSSASISIAREWCRLIGIKFDPERHIAYNNADMMNKISKLNSFEPIIADESIRFACVSGDTFIKTETGYKKIKSLVNKKNFKVYSLNIKTHKQEIRKAEKCIKVKKDIIYEIKTEDNKIIKATKDHKFLTSNGWKKLKELEQGDELIGIKKILKIKSIKKLGKEDVYDIINVDKNNNYIANDFIVHNSSEDWNKASNKELKKKLAQVRTKHLLYILCFPLKIKKLEKTYLESFCNYWCLNGDTRIIIKDRYGTIRSMPMNVLSGESGYKVLSYNKTNKKFEFKKSGKCVKTNNNSEVFKVELVNGMKIKATKEHLFLTKDGYKKLKDLTENDEIIIREKKCLYCNTPFLPKRESMKFCKLNCVKLYNSTPEERYIYQKQYTEKNRDKIKKYRKEHYIKNKHFILNKANKYRKKHRQYINKWAENYRKNNLDLLRKRDKDYRKRNYVIYVKRRRSNFNRYMRENINFRNAIKLRNRLRQLLKSKNPRKNNPFYEILGCHINEFKEYISKKFKKGMTWGNYGKWSIDHIKPCCNFNLKYLSEQKKCFNYKNCQPLWLEENIRKGRKNDSNKN